MDPSQFLYDDTSRVESTYLIRNKCVLAVCGKEIVIGTFSLNPHLDEQKSCIAKGYHLYKIEK